MEYIKSNPDANRLRLVSVAVRPPSDPTLMPFSDP